MSHWRPILQILAIAALALGTFECQAGTLIFTNTGAGDVGVIAGSNIDCLHQVNGSINAGSSGVSVGMTSKA